MFRLMIYLFTSEALSRRLTHSSVPKTTNKDYQLWCDLSELEVRVGKRWVTDDADYERWSRYARERNLQIPRSAIQLHEDLVAD